MAEDIIWSIICLTEERILREGFLVSIQLLPEYVTLNVPKTLHPKVELGGTCPQASEYPWAGQSVRPKPARVGLLCTLKDTVQRSATMYQGIDLLPQVP